MRLLSFSPYSQVHTHTQLPSTDRYTHAVLLCTDKAIRYKTCMYVNITYSEYTESHAHIVHIAPMDRKCTACCERLTQKHAHESLDAFALRYSTSHTDMSCTDLTIKARRAHTHQTQQSTHKRARMSTYNKTS